MHRSDGSSFLYCCNMEDNKANMRIHHVSGTHHLRLLLCTPAHNATIVVKKEYLFTAAGEQQEAAHREDRL